MKLVDDLQYIFRLSVPLILTFLAQVVVEITDAAFLARISPEFLAVSGLSGAFKGVLTIFGVGVLNYSIVIFSNEDQNGISKTLISATYFILIYSFFICSLSYASFEWLSVIGINGNLISQTKPFFGIRLLGVPLFLLFVLSKYYLGSKGCKNIIWMVSLLSILINYLGDLACVVFINDLESQLYGISTCSTITDLFMGASLIIYMLTKDKSFMLGIIRNLTHPELIYYCKKYIIYGVPIGATFVYELLFFFIITLFMGRVGVNELAAYQVVLQLTTFAFMFTLGTSESLMIALSKSLHAKDLVQFNRFIRAGLTLTSFYVVVFFTLFFIFPGIVLQLYFSERTLEQSLPPLTLATMYLSYAAIVQIFDSFQVIFCSILKVYHDTFMPMIFYFTSYFILGLLLSYILCFTYDMGSQGIWLGILVAVSSIFITLLIRLVAKMYYFNAVPNPISQEVNIMSGWGQSN